MILSPETRHELARELRKARLIEMQRIMPDQRLNEKRDRTGETYIDHLSGLQGTLNYVTKLPTAIVVDLGAGSSRAVAQISRSKYGEGLTFLATGIVNDPEIDKHIGRSSYRITPAETMVGFDSSSIGGFISVYGPFEHSAYLDQVLERTDELLVPDGIIKLCIMKKMPGHDEQMNRIMVQRYKKIEDFFKNRGYGLAINDWDIVDKIGTNRTFLGIKPGQGEKDLDSLARGIMEKDLMNLDTMKSGLSDSSYDVPYSAIT